MNQYRQSRRSIPCPDHQLLSFAGRSAFLSHFSSRKHARDAENFPSGKRHCPHDRCHIEVSLRDFAEHFAGHFDFDLFPRQRRSRARSRIEEPTCSSEPLSPSAWIDEEKTPPPAAVPVTAESPGQGVDSTGVDSMLTYDTGVSPSSTPQDPSGGRDVAGSLSPRAENIASDVASFAEFAEASEESESDVAGNELVDFWTDTDVDELGLDAVDSVEEKDPVQITQDDLDLEIVFEAKRNQEPEASEGVDRPRYDQGRGLHERLRDLTDDDRQALELIAVEVINGTTEEAYAMRLRCDIFAPLRARLPRDLRTARKNVCSG